jgi:hypothetical protein
MYRASLLRAGSLILGIRANGFWARRAIGDAR